MHLGLPRRSIRLCFVIFLKAVDVTRIGKRGGWQASSNLDMGVLSCSTQSRGRGRRSIHSQRAGGAVTVRRRGRISPLHSVRVPHFATPRAYTHIPVAEWIVAVTLASLKYIPFYVRMQSTGDWKQRIGAEGALPSGRIRASIPCIRHALAA